jgi:hypothetical protein
MAVELGGWRSFEDDKEVVQMNAKAIDNASRRGGSASVSVPVIGAAEDGVWLPTGAPVAPEPERLRAARCADEALNYLRPRMEGRPLDFADVAEVARFAAFLALRGA